MLEAALVRAGVDRYEADCSVANGPMMQVFISLGFVVTATMTSERWGGMVRFTKFLREAPRTAFQRQFVYGPRSVPGATYPEPAHHTERRHR